MLRINAIPNTAAGKAYYRSADYHLDGQEQPAFWHGRGADMLGLSGEVQRADFEALCENQHPATGDQLTAKHIANRRVGYDFTWSVPKSVSIAATLGGDDRIPDAFRGAVAETMAEMEREMETRVRRNGMNENRRTGNMIWCDFLHTTSRPMKGLPDQPHHPDPQLHIHAVVFNATHDREEGQWKAGEFAWLKANAPYFQAVFRSRLAVRMQQLGYQIRQVKDDFELAGVPPRTLKEFSRRTKQIEKTADLLGVTRPETKAKLGATTREAKTKGLTWDELMELWAERLRPGELEAITRNTAAAVRPVKIPDRHREAVQFALDHLLERSSVVAERKVITEALKAGIGGVTVEGVHAELGRRKDVIRRNVKGSLMVSTQGVLAEERKIQEFAVKGRGRLKALAAKGIISNDTLSPSQKAAIRHVWTSPDRLILIRGAAGTGKTTLTKHALAGVRVPWVILAPSAEASRGVLRRDGFEQADTLAAFLNSEEMQTRVKGGLIWLDEAGLAGARDMSRLIELADQLNARVVLSGDRRQHKSVSRGDVLAMLEDRAGLPVAEVSEIRRQKGEYLKVAEMLSRGQMAKAIEKLDGMGWVRQTDASGPQMVAGDYLASLDAGKSALVVVPTHAEGDAVTAVIRQGLRDQGKLGEERVVRRLNPLKLSTAELKEARKRIPEPGVVFTPYAAYQEGTQALAVGDEIRTTAKIRDLAGREIDNRTVMTVTGWTDSGNMKVRTVTGIDRVLEKDVGHIQAAYTATSQGGQGRTVDHMYLWVPTATLPAVRMDTAYTSGTRGRERLTVYTDNREALLDAIHREDRRLLASDLVQAPRKGIRRRLLRHIAFLRDVTMRGRDSVREVPSREIAHEIELGR